MLKEIYFPMSCQILVKGHITALEKLRKQGFVTVGLLTSRALKGYKKELMPYADRAYILETIAMALGNIDIVPQDSLDPTENIKKYKCRAIASGDGWEKEELEAIKKLKLERIDIKSGSKTHSSDILRAKNDTRRTKK